MGTWEQSPEPLLDFLNSISSGLLHIYAAQAPSNPDRAACSIRWLFLSFLFCSFPKLMWWLRGTREDSGESEDLSCVGREAPAVRWHRQESASVCLLFCHSFHRHTSREESSNLLPSDFTFPSLVMKSWHTGAISSHFIALMQVFLFWNLLSINVCVCVCAWRVCVKGSCCWPIDLLSVWKVGSCWWCCQRITWIELSSSHWCWHTHQKY